VSGEIWGQIFVLDLAPFASSTFQSVPTDSGHSREVRESLSQKLSLLNVRTCPRSPPSLLTEKFSQALRSLFKPCILVTRSRVPASPYLPVSSSPHHLLLSPFHRVPVSFFFISPSALMSPLHRVPASFFFAPLQCRVFSLSRYR
jgi:hypothetical protein